MQSEGNKGLAALVLTKRYHAGEAPHGASPTLRPAEDDIGGIYSA